MNKKWDWFYRNFFFFTIFFLSFFLVICSGKYNCNYFIISFIYFLTFLQLFVDANSILSNYFFTFFSDFFSLTIFWAKIRTMYFYFSFKCLTSKLLMSYRLSSHKELSSIIRSTPEIKEQKMSITWIMIQFNGDFRQLLLCTPQGLSYLLD